MFVLLCPAQPEQWSGWGQGTYPPLDVCQVPSVELVLTWRSHGDDDPLREGEGEREREKERERNEKHRNLDNDEKMKKGEGEKIYRCMQQRKKMD